MKTLDFTYEKGLRSHGETRVLVGVDEAGRGPLAGPVVAAAACFKDQAFLFSPEEEQELRLVRDSKLLSEKQRESVFVLLEKYCWYGLGFASPETIDRVNILEATFLAMKESIAAFQKTVRAAGGLVDHVDPDRRRTEGSLFLIDGNQAVPNCSFAQETVIGGDRQVKSIAAASILAKVTRDRLLFEYDRQWPEYGFAKHKGYGTTEHMAALERYGPLPIHRTSFRPVEQAIIHFRSLGIIT